MLEDIKAKLSSIQAHLETLRGYLTNHPEITDKKSLDGAMKDFLKVPPGIRNIYFYYPGMDSNSLTQAFAIIGEGSAAPMDNIDKSYANMVNYADTIPSSPLNSTWPNPQNATMA